MRSRRSAERVPRALPPTPEIRALRPKLLRWYRANRRDLPWRHTTDPYAIWVAETMLQQTTVAAVIPYYERFMARLPDVRSLASASEETVLALWSGLGYYRRARALRAGAITVLEAFDGRIPDDPTLLVELPGVGRYTAGAIASVAFQREAPIVDGNVRRVLSRLFRLDANGSRGDEIAWAIAAILVRGRNPGDLNQALMELGATVCTPRSPRCSVCPVSRTCLAFASGEVFAYPKPAPRRPPRTVHAAVALIVRDGRVLLERPSGVSPLRGSWDLPARVVAEGERASDVLVRRLAESRDVILTDLRASVTARHAILDMRLRLEVFRCSAVQARSRGALWRYAALETIDACAVSGATRKILALELGSRHGRQGRSHGGIQSGSRREVPRSGSGSRGRSNA